MILEKYQPIEQIQNRGYSATAKVMNEDNEVFFAKWIKGIKKNSQQSKILFDKLRKLKKAVHSSLPKIIEYDWDYENNAYCIIFENKKAETLEEKFQEIHPTYFLKGVEQIIGCLKNLQQEFRLSHGDITPANILVDDNMNFFLIDFGLSDIAATLSQSASEEIFARAFAAPEKWNRKLKGKGFPYQADIYSIGKIIEWFFEKNRIEEYKDIKYLIDNSCKNEPSNRLNFNSLLENLNKITKNISFDDKNLIYVVGDIYSEILDELNNEYFGEVGDFPPKFDVSPKSGDNVLVDIITKSQIIHCLWIINEKKLLIRNYKHKTEDEEKYKRLYKYGKAIDLPVSFKTDVYYNEIFDLTPFFKKIQKEKQHEGEYRKGKREIGKELEFFKELIKKELRVIEKNALRLRYKSFEKKGDYEISFEIASNEKYSSNGFIFNHIDKATPPNPEEFEYIISQTADKKQIKEPVKFTGIAYDFNTKKRILKFKDCERLDFEKIPKNGYIFENTVKQEEEKKRQQEAIRKVEYNEVQNRDLIHYLFNPKDLQGKLLDIYELPKVYQTDDKGIDFIYSPNQTRAILNAIHREPLTVIQGPPGTGKTTVITEIVFQILHKNPDAKILITSQTNDAVDNVLDNLLEKDIPIVRLSGIRKPKETLKKHTLERKIEGWKNEVRKKANKNWKKIEISFKKQFEKENIVLLPIFNILTSKKEWKIKKQQIDKMLQRFSNFSKLTEHLNREDEFLEKFNEFVNIDIIDYFTKLKIHNDWLATISSLDENSHINQKLIDTIRVIGATTNHIAAKKYQKYNFDFDYVIMDESGKATTAEALIPLVMGDKAILVGDHRQLRPMLTSNREVEKWLREKYKNDDDEFDSWDDYFNRPSLFEQVITKIDDDFTSQLEQCRRSSKEQVKLTSKCFYEPYGDEPIIPINRPQSKEHNLDLKIDSSILFIDIGNSYKSKIDGNGSSYNEISMKLIPEILKELDKHNEVKKYSIGVISGYTAQIKRIRNQVRRDFQKNKLNNINLFSNQVAISVVDKFQGLEKDIIIFDLVRSRQNTLGFLANPNRINVALSRQKRLLIIIGNYDWLVQAKAVNSKDKIPALQKYLRLLNKDWIVKNIKQVF